MTIQYICTAKLNAIRCSDSLYCLTDVIEAIQAFSQFSDLAIRQSALNFYSRETGINRTHLVVIVNLLVQQEVS